MATVEVRSGINRMTLELTAGETIEDIYERVETALNLDGSDNLSADGVVIADKGQVVRAACAVVAAGRDVRSSVCHRIPPLCPVD